jgi:hypothetical protein
MLAEKVVTRKECTGRGNRPVESRSHRIDDIGDQSRAAIFHRSKNRERTFPDFQNFRNLEAEQSFAP